METLVATVLDLFVAGVGTTSATLTYFFTYMTLFREEQRKIQNEIDSIMGNQTPSLSYRKSYTEAALLEILRYSTLDRFGMAHRVTQDLNLGEYFIPKVGLSFHLSLFGSNNWIHRTLFWLPI